VTIPTNSHGEKEQLSGSSALVVVLDDRWVQDVERELRQAQAREVIASHIANK
jgi:hypothetical protein